jgi:hypothetical protein
MKSIPGSLFGLLAIAVALTCSILRAQDDNAPAAPAPAQTAPDNGGGTGATGPSAETPTGAISNESATFQTFYDALAPEGTWIQTQQYGFVWQPQVTDPTWAPYTNGYWAYTDQGWFWVSNEAWGWATYHYGRWANLDGVGWVWVPGYVWAPAWVSWRYGDGYAGWAPLPPDSMVGTDYAANTTQAPATETPGYSQPDLGDENSEVVDTGYHIGDDDDTYYGIGPGLYIFLPWGFFGGHDYHDHYCNHGDNFWIIGHTHNVTNVNVARGPGMKERVTTGGPLIAEVNAVSSTPVEKVTINHAKEPGVTTQNGGTVTVFAPKIHASPTSAPTRVGMSVGFSRVNHGVEITRPLVVNSSLVPPLATVDQIRKSQEAQNQAPASGKILWDEGSIKSSSDTPLATLKPLATPLHTGGSTGGAQQVGQMPINSVPPSHVFSQTGQQPVYPTPGETRTVVPSSPYTHTTTTTSGETPGENRIVHVTPSGGESTPVVHGGSSAASSSEQPSSSVTPGWNSAPASSSSVGVTPSGPSSGPVGGYGPASSSSHH